MKRLYTYEVARELNRFGLAAYIIGVTCGCLRGVPWWIGTLGGIATGIVIYIVSVRLAERWRA